VTGARRMNRETVKGGRHYTASQLLAGFGDRKCEAWTGSWTEPPVQTVQ
jgi:hypothetical protein